ncbi:GumC family protein [Bosea sp. (in: a-proteobacteria)]|jgi:succinoglycan biosynthesis transport protein ExoP|uniref:GumC family protein n=1 Tax=Bosea sp. (in: a-proteobacteria) TaxID=1871050 RepID=UPI003F701D29
MKLGATEFISAGRSPGAAFSELSDDTPRNRDVKIHNIVALVWRRKAFIAYFALVGALLTGIAAFVLPPKYTATSQIVIEPTQTQIAAGVMDAVVDTHIATITSDARLRAVLASLSGLPEYEATAPSSSAGSEPTFEARLRDWLLDAAAQLQAVVSTPPANQVPSDGRRGLAPPSLDEAKFSLMVRQERRSSVVSISYKSSNPVRAALIANQIATFHLNTLSQHKQLALENSQQWLDQGLVEARRESDAADEALRAYSSIHGASVPDGVKGEPIAEIVQQLEGVRTELARKKARLERLRDLRRAGADAAPTATLASPSGSARVAQDAPVPDLPNTAATAPGSMSASRPALAREAEAEVERLEHDVRLLRIQERSLAEHTESLQAVSGFVLAQRKEFQTLERRAASAADSVRELSRLKREYKDPPATGVQLLAPASVPLRPSSLSPYLYIPAAVIAFAVLGGVAASTREQLDRTFRQPREIESVLGVPCIGLIPDTRRSSNRPRRPTLEASAYPNAFAIETTCAMTLAVTGHRKEGKIILLTSSHPAEGTTALAEGLASCLQSLRQRVLLVSADIPQEPIHPTPPSAPTGLDEGFTPPPYSGDPDLGFDRLSVMELTAGDPTLLASAALIAGLKRVQERYDYIVMDAPAVFVSPSIPALASMADAVLFAVRWGSTTREVAANALTLLRKPATVRRDPPPNVLAVLTRVDLKSYVRYRPGDAAEYLYDHRARLAANSLS